MNEICVDSNRCVTLRGKEVGSKSCKNWFHAKCQCITDREYLYRKGTQEDTQELKLFEMYVHDIVWTVKGNPLDYIEYANSL